MGVFDGDHCSNSFSRVRALGALEFCVKGLLGVHDVGISVFHAAVANL